MRRVKWVLAALVLTVPSVALAAIYLVTAGGYSFDLQDTYGGYLSDGTSDAYDGAYYFEINGTSYSATGTATTSLGGRMVTMPEQTIGSLRAQRTFYVPATGGDWGRYVDVVTNAGATAATVTISINGNLGSDSYTNLYATSSGDTALTTADSWFGTDDTDGSGDPTLAHVFQGTDPTVRASTATLSGDNFDITYSATIPAGGRVAIMTFAIMTSNRTVAQAEARRLVELPDDALAGIDAYLDDIINFNVNPAGAPRVMFTGPYEVNEGDAVTVDLAVMDPEGDPATWSWDLNDDGTFGEMPGATTYTVAAGTTDGPGAIRIGVEATDGTNTSQRYRTISVVNVDPMITSSPDTITSVGASYRYQIEVLEPGGALDPLAYSVTAGPTNMVVGGSGLVTWTPRETDVTTAGETIRIAVQVADDDGAVDTQEWEMTVSPNHAPTSPRPEYPVDDIGILDPQPRLVAGNASDLDRDPLVYFFELDAVDTFDSAMLVQSPGVPETPGFTAFELPAGLAPGHYYWRVWVSDGTVETDPVTASFWVVPESMALDVDGGGADGGFVTGDGGTTRRDDGGCGCAAPGARSESGAAAALVLAGLVVAAARRRRRTRR